MRDVLGDGRPATVLRKLFAHAPRAVGSALEAMRRACVDDGLHVWSAAGPLPATRAWPRSTVADIGGGRRPVGLARFLALAARTDVDLVAVIGASHGSLEPSILRIDVEAPRARVAEEPLAFAPVSLACPPVADDDAVLQRRISRYLADGRRSQARLVLSGDLARAERRGQRATALALRVALARFSHDDLQPADVVRTLRDVLATPDDDEALAVATLRHRLDACLLASHAEVDLLHLDRARQLSGAAAIVAASLGSRQFEAAHAQWRVCFWRGDLDGARAQAVALGQHARTMLQQVQYRRCALRTLAPRWPDEAVEHRHRLRQYAEAAERVCAGLASRALAEDAVVQGDARGVRAHVLHASRQLGRTTTRRLRGSFSLLAATCGIAQGGHACEPSPLMALCRDAATAQGSLRLRRRTERRAGATGVSLTTVAPWRRPTGEHVMIEELVRVIEACHSDEGAPAMLRLCSLVREQLGAAGVGLYTSPEGRPLASAGAHPCVSTSVSREALARNVVVEPAAAAIGVESAVPVRFGGSPIAALCCRWAYDAPVDRRRATLVLTAAAAICAPIVQAEIDQRARVETPADDLGLLGTSDAMRLLRSNIRRAANAPFPVLIQGDSGVGKELVARAIHGASSRRGRRFCAVNCAAVSDELLEAELFGHSRGAFTGAVTERPGLFEEADGGTLFLDEVGELSPRGQAKLLRVLQEGEVRRVGENVPRRLDVRIVAATNRRLAREVEVGRFRDDLRFRLDVVRLDVPPLRERADDIEVLAQAFWRDALAKTRGRALLDRDAIAALAKYEWPGNVRELQNVIATLAVRAPLRGRVTADDVATVRSGATPRVVTVTGTLDAARREFDAALLRQALAECGGRRAETARRLGMTRQGLLKLMHRLGIERQATERASAAHPP